MFVFDSIIKETYKLFGFCERFLPCYLLTLCVFVVMAITFVINFDLVYYFGSVLLCLKVVLVDILYRNSCLCYFTVYS